LDQQYKLLRRRPSLWSNLEEVQSCYAALLDVDIVYEGHHEFFKVSSHVGKDGDAFGAEPEA